MVQDLWPNQTFLNNFCIPAYRTFGQIWPFLTIFAYWCTGFSAKSRPYEPQNPPYIVVKLGGFSRIRLPGRGTKWTAPAATVAGSGLTARQNFQSNNKIKKTSESRYYAARTHKSAEEDPRLKAEFLGSIFFSNFYNNRRMPSSKLLPGILIFKNYT